MASRCIIDINNNDDLTTVIRKCNRNFRVIVGQQVKQDQIDAMDSSGAISDQISSSVGEAVDSLIQVIESEANARRSKDDDLEDAIDDLRNDIADLVEAAVLATYPVGSAYTTFGNENPRTVIGGTWTNVGTVTVGTSTMNVWRRTA